MDKRLDVSSRRLCQRRTNMQRQWEFIQNCVF